MGQMTSGTSIPSRDCRPCPLKRCDLVMCFHDLSMETHGLVGGAHMRAVPTSQSSGGGQRRRLGDGRDESSLTLQAALVKRTMVCIKLTLTKGSPPCSSRKHGLIQSSLTDSLQTHIFPLPCAEGRRSRAGLEDSLLALLPLTKRSEREE